MRTEYLQFPLEMSSLIQRGLVVELLETGEILVEVDGEMPRRILCGFLETSDQPTMSLEPGDAVLLFLPKTLEEKGCVLGRIGRYRRPEKESEGSERQHVVIEAKKELTLKCGESSIAMRRGGKVLVKAIDVVSRAKRTNKIKGGSVRIN